LLGKDRNLFGTEDDRIRTLDRRWHLNLDNPAQTFSKILYSAVRRKAHPHVMERGLRSSEDKYLVLSPHKDMARRIGRRRDQKPVLLEVMAFPAQEQGVLFYPFGDLFLTLEIPARFISGPPVSQEISKVTGEDTERKQKRPPELQAGTFILEAGRDSDQGRRKKGKKRKGWKEEARKIRRRKEG